MKQPMTPFDTYKEYLAYKNHFSKEKYDYFVYGGKSRASLDSFYKRKDRYFFEKTSRKYKDEDIRNFFLANFVSTDNPQGLWIGNIIRGGESIYVAWQRRQQSLFYNFKSTNKTMLEQYGLQTFLEPKDGHPPLLKEYLGGNLSIEEVVIYEKLFGYCKDYDKKIDDPVWHQIGMKVKKYLPFLNIDKEKYRKQVITEVNDQLQ